MIPIKRMKHTKTSGHIKGRRSCKSSTGKSASFVERRRILTEMNRMISDNVDRLRGLIGMHRKKSGPTADDKTS